MEKGPINNTGRPGEIRPANASENSRPSGRLDREKLKKACTEFESLLVFQMMKFMRRSVPQNGFLGGGPGQDIYQGLLDQELSKSLAQRGSLGVGEKIYKQMIQREEKGTPAEGLKPHDARRNNLE